ncbi:MAG: rhodanese-related sulfurtransferase [Gammaproteobacteria bacterium]
MDSKIIEITPPDAQALLDRDPSSRLIDVRSKVEFDYVGHPPGAIHIAWKEFPDWKENPAFVEYVEATLVREQLVGPDTPLLMLCRSGARSNSAGLKLIAAGYSRVYNVLEGFEGDKDENQHRGNLNGWRFRGLAWQQG